MDLTDTLRNTENALRDFIVLTMHAKHGGNWLAEAEIEHKTILKWNKTKQREESKQKNGVVEPRLIYYADFADLIPILKDNWTLFEPVFGVIYDTMARWLDSILLVRNQEAHGREILEHQKYMALGAAGEIRTRLIRYRSKLETAKDYFPCLERVNDDLGNVWAAGLENPMLTSNILRPDDLITFTIIASHPQEKKLEYCVVSPYYSTLRWNTSNVLRLKITKLDIGQNCKIEIFIRSADCEYHACEQWDDTVAFHYTVLPVKMNEV